MVLLRVWVWLTDLVELLIDTQDSGEKQTWDWPLDAGAVGES